MSEHTPITGELGPTSTGHEPTATERLRALLDERGEYYKTSGNRTWWGRPIDAQTGKPINVFHNQAQPMGEDRLLVELQLATPEQAIAATLGSCNCTNDCTNSERTGTCLPHFWTHDGALHIEATRMPTRIVICEGGTCEFVPKRELDASEAENANLRERITTQKQTIQAYRDESREWREVAERAQAENAKLRELVADMYMRFHGVVIENWAYSSEDFRMYEQRMRELGVEVDG